MHIINLQDAARPKEGSIEFYWFENPNIGLPRTLFHRILIPFEPFDSGLDYVSQPESTELVVEWIKLGIKDPAQLDGITISANKPEGVDASIYLGAAHNWVDIEELTLHQAGQHYVVECLATVDFEQEGVGRSERFSFVTEAVYRGEA